MKYNQRFELLAPTIDQRDYEHLVEQLNKKVSFYAPEWSFSEHNPDFGSALALIFLHLLEGNISRLNKIPYKSLITFLNHFNIDRAPATSAVANVQFTLTEGSPESVFIEKGLQLSAKNEETGEPIIFETASTALLTPARMEQIIAVFPKEDRIVRHVEDEHWQHASEEELGSPSSNSTFMLYGHNGENIQEHTFYIEHSYLFHIESPSSIEIVFHYPMQEKALFESVELLGQASLVVWEYYSEGEWHAFDAVHSYQNRLRLLKLQPRAVEEYDLNGQVGRYIRCRAHTLSAEHEALALGKVQFHRLLLKTDFAKADDASGIKPSYTFYNDMPIQTTEGCEPFGDFFTTYGCFYIGHEEVLSKKGAEVSISFSLSYRTHRLFPDKPKQINWKPIMKREVLDKVDLPDPVTITRVQWEYWNGRSWAVLQTSEDASTMFQFIWEGEQQRQLNFVVPEDIEQFEVNGEESLWIRGKIVNVANPYSIDAVYYAPYIQQLSMIYYYDHINRLPEQLLSYNNLEWQNLTGQLRTGGIAIRPFKPLQGYQPTVWFGFNKAPERGPIHLFFDLVSRHWTAEEVPHLEWEYLRATGSTSSWSPLVISDDTQSFSRSGTIQFVGPRDFAYAEHFGKQQYWIRVVNRDTRLYSKHEADYEPLVKAIYMNTVKVLQQQTITDEKPIFIDGYDVSLDETASYYALSLKPVISERVWVDETESLHSHELDQLKLQSPERLNIMYDSEDHIMQIWVEYDCVEHFLYSKPHDRHYCIDRATGKITFGNGLHGSTLAVNGNDRVRVSYVSGGGKAGNIDREMINTMQNAIAFIDSVKNINAAAGGCDAGTVAEAVQRGTKFFAHRGRAVIAEDFEWITKSIHPNVAKVKCLANTNVKLQKELGAMTIVVLPFTGHGQNTHFLQLKKLVEERLLKATPSSIAFPNRLQVIEPVYVEIGVRATVWVKHMDDVVIVERELQRKLAQFLHPITGNHDGRGWEIGQKIHPSMFFALMKSVGPVVHIPQLLLEAYKLELGQREEYNPDKLHLMANSMIISGQHRITVEVR